MCDADEVLWQLGDKFKGTSLSIKREEVEKEVTLF